MYPPSGSFRYRTPQPTSNYSKDDYEEDCHKIIDWVKRTCLFKSKFWKLMLMVVLVISSAHFSTVMMFPSARQSLFVVKSLDHSISVSYHRKMSTVRIINVPVAKRQTVRNQSLVSLSTSTRKPKTPLQVVGSREKNPINQTLKMCPPISPNLSMSLLISPNLNGPYKVTLNNIPSLEAQEKMSHNLEPGGRFRPKECKSRSRVAIIIPFRDRAAHLAVFLFNIHPFLQRQQLDYSIFIVEQEGNKGFNRAMLLNVGSLEALKLYPYECFIFHDVDLIPEDDHNLYTCPQQPRHMSVAINTFKYKLPYNDIFGGVSAMTVPQFQTVNGFSNKFWGWGGEDDDMSNRIKYFGYYISRFPANVARYTMISHKKDKPNPQRYKILKQGRNRYKKDGLNSAKYSVLNLELRPLYTWLKVKLFAV